jgi:hypothetical protein
MILAVVLLSGCSRQHDLYWPGVHVHGESPISKPGDVGYRKAYWSRDTFEDPTPTPMFSFRAPNGALLTPDSMTIETMDAHGAEDKFYGPGIGRHFDFGNGWMTAYFDHDRNLESIAVILSSIVFAEDPRRTIFIGNRDGTKWVSFPATRGDLIELFGEPNRERSYIPQWH